MRLQIVRGEDRTPIIKLREKKTLDPFDLTACTNISVQFTKSNRTNMVLDFNEIPAMNASIVYGTVTFTADNPGDIGNSIVLVFNGTDTVDDVIDVWNTANPANTVSHSGVGTEVLTLGSIMLQNGRDAYVPVTIVDAKLGRIQLTLTDLHTKQLRRGENQSFTVIIDFGIPPAGVRRIARFVNALDIID